MHTNGELNIYFKNIDIQLCKAAGRKNETFIPGFWSGLFGEFPYCALLSPFATCTKKDRSYL